MGAFLLVRQSGATDTQSLTERGLATLAKQGFDKPKLIERDEYRLYLCRKIVAPVTNCIELHDGDFCAHTGTLLFRGLTGEHALKAIYDVFDPDRIHDDRLYGAFCLIVRKNGQTCIIGDRLGVYKSYVDEDQVLWSSSFLATCSASTRLRIDAQSMYEYVFQGATYGNSTPFSNVRLIDPDKVYRIDQTVTSRERAGRIRVESSSRPVDELLADCLHGLRSYYVDIVSCFGDNIDTALSGGYDSRLTLALLLEQGSRPRVHVYGKPADPDVVVAKRIDAGEGLGLTHTDKSSYPTPTVDGFAEVIRKNFFAFDACPPDGIFNSGSDLATRRDRCASGELMLNGGGGEIYRNFFYLRDTSFSVRQLLWAFYSRFDPKACADSFSERDYYSSLGGKIKSTLGTVGETLNRTQVESIYPLFRCRYWMGKNNTVNNYLGSALTPFIDYAIVKDALVVPLKEKNFGRFQARMICSVSPELAAYDSCYGHNFVDDVPMKRMLEEVSVYLRPTVMRRFSYRVKMSLAKKNLPTVLSGPYLRRVLDADFPNMSDFFRVARVADGEQYNRICTLEYLLQEYGAKTTRRSPGSGDD